MTDEPGPVLAALAGLQGRVAAEKRERGVTGSLADELLADRAALTERSVVAFVEGEGRPDPVNMRALHSADDGSGVAEGREAEHHGRVVE